jgi:hypothetical protein
MRVDLLVRGEARGDEPVPHLPDSGCLQRVAGGRGDREAGVGLDVHQTRLAQQPRQHAPVGEIGTALPQQFPETGAEPVGPLLLRAVLVGADQRLQRGVGVLDQQHPAGAQRPDHGAQRRVALGDVDQDETGVHQVERAGRGVVAADIVPEHLDAFGGGRPGPGDVDVGGEHAPGGPDPLAQPRRHARPAGSDLPAPPPLGDPGRFEVPERRGVEEGRQRVEARPGLGLPVVQEVSLVLTHEADPVTMRPGRFSAVRGTAAGAVPRP